MNWKRIRNFFFLIGLPIFIILFFFLPLMSWGVVSMFFISVSMALSVHAANLEKWLSRFVNVIVCGHDFFVGLAVATCTTVAAGGEQITHAYPDFRKDISRRTTGLTVHQRPPVVALANA